MQSIQQAAATLYPTTHQRWQDLNALAEPSGAEHRTAAFIVDALSQMGVECWQVAGATSVIARVQGSASDSDRVIGLRCEIDALPYPEGYRHCCFHAGHSAILLSAVEILHQRRANFGGTVYAIFQSSEENFPSGSRYLVENGTFQSLGIQQLIALHSSPELPAGIVAFREGWAQASTDKVYIHVRATGNIGNHISRPHEAMNPIGVAGSLLMELQKINTQFADPILPTLLNWAKIESNHIREASNVNIVPSACFLAANFRTFNQPWREVAKSRIYAICKGVEQMYAGWGVEVDTKIEEGVPPVINDIPLTQALKAAAVDYLGEAQVQEAVIRMGGDDFAYFTLLTDVPGCMFRLGTGLATGQSYGLHHPDFISTVDPDCLRVGSGLLIWQTERLLERAI